MNNGQIDIFIVFPSETCNKNLGTISVKFKSKKKKKNKETKNKVWYNSLKNINHLGLDAQINN